MMSNGIAVSGITFSGGTRAYRVRYKHVEGFIEVAEYIERPASAIAKLCRDSDIVIVGKRVKELREQIEEIDEFEPVLVIQKPGYNGPYHALPDGSVTAPEGLPIPALAFRPDPSKCHVSGSLEGWLEGVATPLVGHRLAEFLMMVPFAGPLRSLTTRPDNFGFQLVGKPGDGKSALMNMQSSTTGAALGGENGNYGLSFAATSAAIEAEMKNYNDLYIPIDEENLFGIGLSDKARVAEFLRLVMYLGKGQSKSRFGTSSEVSRFVLGTTANESLPHMTGRMANSAIVAAVSDRLMTIDISGREFGVFDHMPVGFTDYADCLKEVAGILEVHHGTAMRAYLQKVVQMRHDDEAGLRRRIELKLSQFRERINVAPGGSARRVADAFGLVYAAGALAQHAGVLPRGYAPIMSAIETYGLHIASTTTEPAALKELQRMMADPAVVDLDRHERPRLTRRKLARHPGFWRTNREGVLEYLVHPDVVRARIPTWNQDRTHFAVSSIIARDRTRNLTLKRQVRQGHYDRMVAIVRPHEAVEEK